MCAGLALLSQSSLESEIKIGTINTHETIGPPFALLLEHVSADAK